MVDQETYNAYRAIDDPEIKVRMDQYLNLNTAHKGFADFAQISLDKDNLCPFLSTGRLCMIQQKQGITSLCRGCLSYPRFFNQVNDTIECSLSVSCPVVARELLLNPQKITFGESFAEIDTRTPLVRQINLKTMERTILPADHFYMVRKFSIGILQDRSLLFMERMIILGMFCRKLQNLITENKTDEIPAAIDYYLKQISNGGAKDNLQKISPHIGIQFELIRELIATRIECGTRNSGYIEHYNQFMKGIGYSKEQTVDAMVDTYQRVYDSYYKPFMNSHEHLFENYAVNYAFQNLFPFGKPGKHRVFEEYVMLVINVSMIRLHLVGIAGYNKGLDDSIFTSLIYSMARAIEHCGQYLDLVFENLVRCGYTSMPFMAILLKG
jgi:lysine-N-methylase